MGRFLVFALILSAACIPEASASISQRALVDAIYVAEGGASAKKPFGVLSVPCSGYTACRKICENTVRNNLKRWERKGRPGDYIDFLGARYAPISAHPLNKNWTRNVRAIYERKIK